MRAILSLQETSEAGACTSNYIPMLLDMPMVNISGKNSKQSRKGYTPLPQLMLLPQGQRNWQPERCINEFEPHICSSLVLFPGVWSLLSLIFNTFVLSLLLLCFQSNLLLKTQWTWILFRNTNSQRITLGLKEKPGEGNWISLGPLTMSWWRQSTCHN